MECPDFVALLQPSTLRMLSWKKKIHKKITSHPISTCPVCRYVANNRSFYKERFRGGELSAGPEYEVGVKFACLWVCSRFLLLSTTKPPPLGRVIIGSDGWFQDGSTNSQTWNPSHPAALQGYMLMCLPINIHVTSFFFLMLPVI